MKLRRALSGKLQPSDNCRYKGNNRFEHCGRGGFSVDRWLLTLAITELVNAQLLDAELHCRSRETQLFRGSVFPSHLPV